MASKNNTKAGFASDFLKETAKIPGVSTSSAPPRYWFGIGNHAVNAVMTGDYDNCIAQGRILGIVGPSGSGKSFLVGNAVRQAQQQGAICLVVDSENALDDDYMSAIGVNVGEENAYYYRGVSTVSQVIKIVSSFIKGYKASYGEDPDAPPVLIAIDSLNMLQTDTSAENYDKGIQKGDQGQKAKQVKAMLLDFVQDIKSVNISIIVTGHVYRNQDPLNGEGVWIVNDGMRFALSNIILVTKLRLRDKGTRDFSGITLKAFGYKTRFTKPFQSVSIDVPYDEGIDRFSGVLDIAVAQGIVVKSGSRYTIAGEDKSWYAKDFHLVGDRVLEEVRKNRKAILAVADDVEEEQPDAVTDE